MFYPHSHHEHHQPTSRSRSMITITTTARSRPAAQAGRRPGAAGSPRCWCCSPRRRLPGAGGIARARRCHLLGNRRVFARTARPWRLPSVLCDPGRPAPCAPPQCAACRDARHPRWPGGSSPSRPTPLAVRADNAALRGATSRTKSVLPGSGIPFVTGPEALETTASAGGPGKADPEY